MKIILFIIVITLSLSLFSINAQTDSRENNRNVIQPVATDSVNIVEKDNLELLVKRFYASLLDFRCDENGKKQNNLHSMVRIDRENGFIELHPIEILKKIDPESVAEIRIYYGRKGYIPGGLMGKYSGIIEVILLPEEKEEQEE